MVMLNGFVAQVSTNEPFYSSFFTFNLIYSLFFLRRFSSSFSFKKINKEEVILTEERTTEEERQHILNGSETKAIKYSKMK